MSFVIPPDAVLLDSSGELVRRFVSAISSSTIGLAMVDVGKRFLILARLLIGEKKTEIYIDKVSDKYMYLTH